jgi:hypothetical protein
MRPKAFAHRNYILNPHLPPHAVRRSWDRQSFEYHCGIKPSHVSDNDNDTDDNSQHRLITVLNDG